MNHKTKQDSNRVAKLLNEYNEGWITESTLYTHLAESLNDGIILLEEVPEEFRIGTKELAEYFLSPGAYKVGNG